MHGFTIILKKDNKQAYKKVIRKFQLELGPVKTTEKSYSSYCIEKWSIISMIFCCQLASYCYTAVQIKKCLKSTSVTKAKAATLLFWISKRICTQYIPFKSYIIYVIISYHGYETLIAMLCEYSIAQGKFTYVRRCTLQYIHHLVIISIHQRINPNAYTANHATNFITASTILFTWLTIIRMCTQDTAATSNDA